MEDPAVDPHQMYIAKNPVFPKTELTFDTPSQLHNNFLDSSRRPPDGPAQRPVFWLLVVLFANKGGITTTVQSTNAKR